MVSIDLPEDVMRELEERAARECMSVEELVYKFILKCIGRSDPEADVELHLRLCEKYLRVKALAAKEGRVLKSRRELWGYVDELAEKLGDLELRRLWRTANALHQNFYENWMPPRDVEYAVRDVEALVRRLREHLAGR